NLRDGVASSGRAHPGVRGADLRLRLGAAGPPLAAELDPLAGLDRLVDLEEVLDLQPQELVEIGDVAQVRLAWVGARHTDHLRRESDFVAHPEHPDGQTAD